MPSKTVKSIANKSGHSAEKIEGYWEKAKKQVKDEYDDVEEDSDQYWKLVTAITKSMAGIDGNQVNESFEKRLEESVENLDTLYQLVTENTGIGDGQTTNDNNVEWVNEYGFQGIDGFEGDGFYVIKRATVVDGPFDTYKEAQRSVIESDEGEYEEYTADSGSDSGVRIVELDEKGFVLDDQGGIVESPIA